MGKRQKCKSSLVIRYVKSEMKACEIVHWLEKTEQDVGCRVA